MIGKTQYRQGVSIIDVLLVFIVALLALFIVQSWENRLADVFFTLAWVIVLMYVIASITGGFKNLILRTPTWTITGLISLPIWFVINLIPIPSSTGFEFDETNALIQLFGKTFVDNVTQGFLIPWIETIILVGFITVFLLKQNKPDTPRIVSGFGKGKQTNKQFGFLIMFIAIFGAVIHYSVGLVLISEGVGFDYFLLHQVLTFFIFAFIGITPLGLGGAVASHITKNTMVLVATTGDITFFVSMFVVFMILDFIALKTNKGEDTHKKILKSAGLGV